MKTIVKFLNRLEAWLQSLPWDTGDDYVAPEDRRTLAQEMDETPRTQGIYSELYSQYSPYQAVSQIGRHDHQFPE